MKGTRNLLYGNRSIQILTLSPGNVLHLHENTGSQPNKPLVVSDTVLSNTRYCLFIHVFYSLDISIVDTYFFSVPPINW